MKRHGRISPVCWRELGSRRTRMAAVARKCVATGNGGGWRGARCWLSRGSFGRSLYSDSDPVQTVKEVCLGCLQIGAFVLLTSAFAYPAPRPFTFLIVCYYRRVLDQKLTCRRKRRCGCTATCCALLVTSRGRSWHLSKSRPNKTSPINAGHMQAHDQHTSLLIFFAHLPTHGCLD